MPYIKKGGHGGPGRGQGNKPKRGPLRPYADREAVGKTSFRVGMRCVELRDEKPIRSRDDIIEQVVEECGRSTARVVRCWKQINKMLGHLRDDLKGYEPTTLPGKDLSE